MSRQRHDHVRAEGVKRDISCPSCLYSRIEMPCFVVTVKQPRSSYDCHRESGLCPVF